MDTLKKQAATVASLFLGLISLVMGHQTLSKPEQTSALDSFHGKVMVQYKDFQNAQLATQDWTIRRHVEQEEEA